MTAAAGSVCPRATHCLRSGHVMLTAADAPPPVPHFHMSQMQCPAPVAFLPSSALRSARHPTAEVSVTCLQHKPAASMHVHSWHAERNKGSCGKAHPSVFPFKRSRALSSLCLALRDGLGRLFALLLSLPGLLVVILILLFLRHPAPTLAFQHAANNLHILP